MIFIHKAFNRTEIAVRYYQQKNKFTNREQARKNFQALKKYDAVIIEAILYQIYNDQKNDMKSINFGFNRTEIAEMYYRKKGGFTTREQAKRNFRLLRCPDHDILNSIFDQIWREQKKLQKNRRKDLTL